MSKKADKTRSIYSPEFKEQAVKLAQELGSSKQAAEKLGIKHFQTLSLWVRQAKKREGNPIVFDELQRAKEEIKKLKKDWKRSVKMSLF